MLFLIGHKYVGFLAFFYSALPVNVYPVLSFVGVLVRFNFRKICRFDEIYYTAPSLHCFCWLSNCSTFVIGGIQPDFDFILFSGKICGNAIVAIYLFQMKSKHCIEIHKLWIWNPSVENPDERDFPEMQETEFRIDIAVVEVGEEKKMTNSLKN